MVKRPKTPQEKILDLGKKAKEFTDKVTEDFEFLRERLPISRGGEGGQPVQDTGGSKKSRRDAGNRTGRGTSNGRSARTGGGRSSRSGGGRSARSGGGRSARNGSEQFVATNFQETIIPEINEVDEMITPEEIIQAVINEPLKQLTPDMLEVINDPSILMNDQGELFRNAFAQSFAQKSAVTKKKKKKVSKYQKELGRQLKLLKKKHPRTSVTKLMKKAHAATKKALK